MGNLVAGFIAILIASKGTGLTENTAMAGILIFVASIFDLLDGSLARALKVESAIGVQLDSLADSVSYGIAPGYLSYQAYLYRLPEIGLGLNAGMILAALFPICATVRLARFNILDVKKGFQGLPSPPAGIFIASIFMFPFANIMFFGRFEYTLPLNIFIFLFVCTALLMVSNVSYTKIFSDIMKKGLIPTIITIAVIIMVLVFAGMVSVFACTLLYIVAGIIRYTIKIFTAQGQEGSETD
jgi:CDP-diacylglycerol--serine O-phosphatidyltransferase